MDIIEWQDFERVELRVGTILGAAPNPKARKPAYILEVDLGPLGLRTSSAQLTAHYQAEELVGRQVLCVCNFARSRSPECARRSWSPGSTIARTRWSWPASTSPCPTVRASPEGSP